MSVITTVIDWQALYRRSQDECELLREQLRQLTDLERMGESVPVGDIMRVKAAFGISTSMARLLVVFAENETATRSLVAKLSPSIDCFGNSLPVRIAQLRAFIRPHGLTIENVYKVGWHMSPEDRAIVRKAYGA